MAFFNITNYLLLGYMPSYLDENLGISDNISTPVTAIVLIIMVPFALTFGKLGDKLEIKSYNNWISIRNCIFDYLFSIS